MPEVIEGRPAGSERVTWQAVTRYFPGYRIGNYLRPLPDHGLLYVKNPKAATTTLMAWLDRVQSSDPRHQLERPHKENRLPTLGQVGRAKVMAMLAGEAYRFAFVRHPLRRFESVYWDKMMPGSRLRLNSRRALACWPDPHAEVSFEQFLTAVEHQDPVSEMDSHWRPQHVNLMHPLISYDHVGRLESFDDDLERITEEAGLPKIPVERRHPSRHTSSDSVYDGRPDLVRRVEQLYATDYEVYGY